jgi:hypothetical protein
MIETSGRTGTPRSYSVGNQYAERSVRGPQRALAGFALSDAGVESASVERLPTNVWLCDFPGWLKKTIGSSLLRCVELHETTK